MNCLSLSSQPQRSHSQPPLRSHKARQGGDAPKATPATPATPAAGAPGQAAKPATPGQPAKASNQEKSSTTKSSKGDPTKTQTRAGDPKGAAKGQTK